MRTAFFFAILASAAGAPRDGHPTGAGHRIHHIRRERANERRRRLEQREHVAKARAGPCSPLPSATEPEEPGRRAAHQAASHTGAPEA